MIKAVSGDQSPAFFKFWVKSFSISGSGEAQVKSHAKSKSHNDNIPLVNQSTFVKESGKSQFRIPTKVMFSSEEQVPRAEVLRALHVVTSNYSFASSDNDNEWFKVMFPDSKIVVRVKLRLDTVLYCTVHSVLYSSICQTNVNI